jgi:serine protease Do
MLKKIKYILIILALISLILGSSGCSLPLPWSPTPSPPTSSPPSNSSEYANPDWAWPANSSPPVFLPDFPPVIAKVIPAVVQVNTEMAVSTFLGQYTQAVAGSGVIIDEEGYIVTNNHVVENANKIQVELADSRTFPAEIVGTDTLTDLAVLKINAENLSHAVWGDSSKLTLGNWVIAIGNALGQGISATVGTVTCLDVSVTVSGSTLRGLIQTQTPINPGNSGGPLVNMAGEVTGITSVKVAQVGVEGMSYAISSNSTKPIIEDLIHQGYVTRPWLGVSLYTVDPFVAAANKLSVDKGAVIVEVLPDSPADVAGLRERDVIIRFAGKEINTTDDLLQAIHDCQIGQRVEITFVRGKDTKTTLALLQESPPPWD